MGSKASTCVAEAFTDFLEIVKAQPDELLISLVNRAGASVPHVATTLNYARFSPVTHAWSKRMAD